LIYFLVSFVVAFCVCGGMAVLGILLNYQ
jgi:hypothetical protein